MKVRIFHVSMAAFLVFSLIGIRLHVTGMNKAGNIFIILAGSFFITLIGLAFGALPRRVFGKRVNVWTETLVYFLFSLICFWACGLFDL